MFPSARPPGSEQHHYQERAQNREQDRRELHPLGYLTKKDIQRGHNSPVLSYAGPPKRAVTAPDCEALSKRRLASRFRSVKSGRPIWRTAAVRGATPGSRLLSAPYATDAAAASAPAPAGPR